MIERVVLRNFRGIVEGELRLSPLTILVGPNNSGKTTVLEALLLAHGFRDVFGGYTLAKILSEIHKSIESEGLDHLIHKYGASGRALVTYYVDGSPKSIIISVSADGRSLLFQYIEGTVDFEAIKEGRGAVSGALQIATINRFSGGGGFKAKKLLVDALMVRYEFLDAMQSYLYHSWAEVVGKGISGRVAEWLSRVVGEDYIDLTAEPFGERPALYLYRSDRFRVRVSDVGDGVRLLAVARMMVEYLEPNLILWDDVESHMNPRALTLLASWLADLAESGKQVVVTTHSLEALEVVAEAAGEKALIARLTLSDGLLQPSYYSADEVAELKEAGIDVRA